MEKPAIEKSNMCSTNDAGKPEDLMQYKYPSALPYQPVIQEFPLSYTDEEGGKAFIFCLETCSDNDFV